MDNKLCDYNGWLVVVSIAQQLGAAIMQVMIMHHVCQVCRRICADGAYHTTCERQLVKSVEVTGES